MLINYVNSGGHGHTIPKSLPQPVADGAVVAKAEGAVAKANGPEEGEPSQASGASRWQSTLPPTTVLIENALAAMAPMVPPH